MVSGEWEVAGAKVGTLENGIIAEMWSVDDIENANFIALAHNMMPLLLEAVEIVRSNHVGNPRAEILLEQLK